VLIDRRRRKGVSPRAWHGSAAQARAI